MTILHKVQNYIQQHQLLQPDKSIIVGLSGGKDSVALIHILISLGYKCIAAHCNFHLRDEESNRDEHFSESFSKSLDIPFFKINFDTKQYARVNQVSIEMAARDLRYNWFYKLLQTNDAQAIAIAHHADDSIETMLMNLVRGTGLKGLTGIANKNNKVVRPLLCCSRMDVDKYIIDNHLTHIEDSSNATLEYQRNKFRNVIIPMLEEINPSVRQTLYGSINRLAGTLAIYNDAIDKIKNDLIERENETIKIKIASILNHAQPHTILYELVQEYGFNYDNIIQIVEQLNNESGKVFYSNSHRIIIDRDFLIINELNIDKNYNKSYIINAENDENTELPIKFNISKINNLINFSVSKNKDCIHLDSEKIKFPLVLRHWHEGDTFFPLGMTNKKKVSDFFINNKFSLLDKENTWLLLSENNIVWIVGHRIDDRFKVTEGTKTIIEFRII